MLYVIRMLCSHAFCESGCWTQSLVQTKGDQWVTFDTGNQQQTPDNHHLTTVTRQPGTTTTDNGTQQINSQQASTDFRQPTTDNYHWQIHPTTETVTRQITFNNTNKTTQQAKVESNDPSCFICHKPEADKDKTTTATRHFDLPINDQWSTMSIDIFLVGVNRIVSNSAQLWLNYIIQ
jgi:hypothetical protein